MDRVTREKGRGSPAHVNCAILLSPHHIVSSHCTGKCIYYVNKTHLKQLFHMMTRNHKAWLHVYGVASQQPLTHHGNQNTLYSAHHCNTWRASHPVHQGGTITVKDAEDHHHKQKQPLLFHTAFQGHANKSRFLPVTSGRTPHSNIWQDTVPRVSRES